MRAIFACGVLETFLERDFRPFDLSIGCSAGGCILASYLAGQLGRNRHCYTQYMTRPEFIDAKRFLRGGHWVDFDWLWHAMEQAAPIDRARLAANPTQFLLSTTSYATGKPVFLDPAANDIDLMTALKASCALPILYRSPVHVGEQRLLDGGVSAPIPVQEAYRRGARRILVIRSRPPRFIKRASMLSRLSALAYGASPAFAHAIVHAHEAYRDAVSFILAPPSDCEIVHVAPAQPLATGRTTQAIAALEADYELGRRAGELAIQRWNAPLAAYTEQAAS
ncbi:MAG: hypothetical protein RL701_4710 [Pseudomonadota bacterium]